MLIGIQKRRIYDLINIYESLGIIVKKGKNDYIWKGLNEVPNFLEKVIYSIYIYTLYICICIYVSLYLPINEAAKRQKEIRKSQGRF